MRPWQCALAVATVILGLALLAACAPPPYRPPRPFMGGDDPGHRRPGFFFRLVLTNS